MDAEVSTKEMMEEETGELIFGNASSQSVNNFTSVCFEEERECKDLAKALTEAQKRV